MKTIQVEYETYDGQVKVKTLQGYDQQHAINQLVNCREVNWAKLVQEEETENVGA